MKERKLFAGARLKRLRRDLKLTQVRMAEELGVSGSYLNLMERNQRPVTAQVLIRLVETYDLDLGMFAAEPDQRTFLALREAASDPVLRSLALDDQDLKELNEVHPLGAQALVKLHKAYRNLAHTNAGLTERLTDEPMPGHSGQRPEELVRERVQQCEGYFPEIEEAAELFRAETRLTQTDLFQQLCARLQQLHSIRTRIMPENVMRMQKRRFDRHSRRLLLSDLLSDHQICFQLAVQIAHLELRDLMDEKCFDPDLQQAGATELFRASLADHFAMAVLLPYEKVRQQAEEDRYDIGRLAARFGADPELIIRRLASLRRPGAAGLPMFFLRLDRAGNVIERGGVTSFAYARFGGTCPKWNVWQSLQNAPAPKIDFIEMTGGEQLLSVGFAIVRKDPEIPDLSYSQIMVFGCAANRAMETVYGQRLGEFREITPSAIGPGCRVCERVGCGQRSVPALLLGAAGTGNERRNLPILSAQWSGEN